ncbi:MAG: glucans biosynthesis glucosyltransferase MdoH [Kiloniellales bacterium]
MVGSSLFRDMAGLDAGLRRAAVFGTALASTALAGSVMWRLLSLNGFGLLEQLLFVIFIATFLWIAQSFWGALAGFFALVSGVRPQGLALPGPDAPPLTSRTAILLPIHNEEPGRVFANLQAMAEALHAIGASAERDSAFDFFVLSDTTDPAIWLAEEAAWFELRQRLQGKATVYYRRRNRNHARKAGNIADFCTRWGAHYDFMVVLDADSLMAADTLITLARTIEANPRTGLIQVPPVLINRLSLFARLQQFASNLAGPICAAGQAYWQLGDGNFWGHNAIIRTRAFAESCGLPVLPGRKPFGGHILSHDFVEAALLRRAGWQVWMLPELGGSYEESPPTLLDYAVRDRRWCQGNLQHLRVLPAAGLHPVSRLHLLLGVMSYVVSPIWLLFLVIGLAAALATSLGGTRYFFDDVPFPVWPRSDAQGAIALFCVALAMLMLPKLLGWLRVVASRRRARAFGGRLRVTVSLLLEILASTLLAPAMMVFHSLFVVEILLGRDSGWGRQARSEGRVRLGEALLRHSWQLAAALLLAVTLTVLPMALFWWFLPLLAGLLLTPLLTLATSSPRLGRLTARLGLFLIPEEVEPSALGRGANALAAEPLVQVPLVTGPGRALAALLADPRLAALHQAIIVASGEAPPPRDLAAQALARCRAQGPDALTPDEEAVLLADPASLAALLDEASGVGLVASHRPAA